MLYNFESRDDDDDENERAVLVSLLNSSISLPFKLNPSNDHHCRQPIFQD